ncbi:MAG: mtlD [Frankiales bacterium]|nr:mtlD [Frankiales bacterium]
MTGARSLSRRGGDDGGAAALIRGAAAPIRMVHLGLGNFFRAHQAWYTEFAGGEPWGIAAFTGRSASLADTLRGQDGLYTLITRSAMDDRFEVIGSVAAAHPAADEASWLRYLASPDVEVVTLTITEAGYRSAGVGRVKVTPPTPLMTGPARLMTGPARLVAGLAARRRADGGPLTIVSCDNLPDNGAVTERAIAEAARHDPALASWIAETVSYVTTVVDRITPRPTAAEGALVIARTGFVDRAPVVTEPLTEWVLSGTFAAGRPAWDDAGALFTDDIEPFEQRKLWLLNGAHSLLAYTGSVRGHRTVAEAIADDLCRGWLEQWWTAAASHLNQPASELTAYRASLISRFENPRIEHLLAQIAADGSQKLPVRILPVLRAELDAGRLPGGAVQALAGWICHLRGDSRAAPVNDPRADEFGALAGGPMAEAVPRVLAALDPALDGSDDLVTAVTDAAAELERAANGPH